MHKLELTEPETLKTILKSESRRNAETRFLHQLHCATLVGQGISCYQIAEWFDESPRTIERWIHILQENGIEALKYKPNKRHATKFSLDNNSLIFKDIKEDPRTLGYDKQEWSGRLLQRHLRIRFRIYLGIRQCQRILKQTKSFN